MRKNSVKNTRVNGEVMRVLAGLKSAEGYIRNQLARKINLRNTPEIRFIIDQSIEYGVNMSRMIDEVNRADDEKHVDDDAE